MGNINTDNYSGYSKIECYTNTDELVFEAVLVRHTDIELKDLINFMYPKYHRMRVTTSQIVHIHES